MSKFRKPCRRILDVSRNSYLKGSWQERCSRGAPPSTFQSTSSFSFSPEASKHTSFTGGERQPEFRFLSTFSGDKSGNDDELEQYSEEMEGEEDDNIYEGDYEYDDYTDEGLPERGKRKRRNKAKKDDQQRIWLHPSSPLKDRVDRFVNQPLGTLHPLDIKLASVDLIRECGKQKSFEGLNQGHDLLDRLLEEKRYVNSMGGVDKQHQIVISDRPFQVLMYGWSNLSRKVPFATQRMREIIDLMIEEAEYDEEIKTEFGQNPISREAKEIVTENDAGRIFSGRSCQPTVDIYNTLLQGLVQASNRSIAAAGEAEDVLIRMQTMHRERGWHTKPNTKSFMLAINAFAKTRHRTAGDRAENILRNMIDYHEQEKILYLEETGTEYNDVDASMNQRKIVTPDTIAYSAVIQAHANSNSKGSAEKALALLTAVIESNNPSLKPDAFLFANTINAYAKSLAKEKSAEKRLEAAERAEYILWLMIEVFKSSQVSSSTRTDDDLDNNFAKNFDVNIVPFNACLKAWAQSNTPGSPQRAEDILFKILDPECEETKDVKPNTTSFNTCMQAWARNARTDMGAPQKAEDLLNTLIEQGVALNIQPDAQSYTTVMNAYARSDLIDKATQSRRVLNLLLSNDYLRSSGEISAVPFTVLLNSVAHTDNTHDTKIDISTHMVEFDDSDPYSLALEAYDELINDLHRLDIEPDHLTFAAMLDVIRQHTDSESIERRQRVENVLKDTCTGGCVSSLVLKSLFQACPSPDLLRSLLEVKKPLALESVNALPREWTRNVPPAFRKLRRSQEENKRRWKGKKK